MSKILLEQNARLMRASEKVTVLSMFSIPTVLHKYTIVGFHSSVKLHTVLHFETKHYLSLRQTRKLEKSILNISQILKESKFADQCRSVQPKLFLAILKLVWKYLNLFLKETDNQTLGSSLRIEYFQRQCGGRLSGFLTDIGTLHQMEAVNNNAMEQIFSFFV